MENKKIIAPDIYKSAILISISCLGIVLFANLTSPFVSDSFYLKVPLINKLAFDLPQYAGRFLSSFLFLGLMPLISAFALKFKAGQIGIAKPLIVKKKLFWIFLISSSVILGALSSLDKGVNSFYPYSKAFPELILKYGWAMIFIHPISYFLFYYLPWEILFRGVLIFPFIDSGKLSPIIFMQVIPSAMLHFGHPFSETLSAIVFGTFAAILAVKTRSIIPGLIFHAVLGISLDLTLIISNL